MPTRRFPPPWTKLHLSRLSSSTRAGSRRAAAKAAAEKRLVRLRNETNLVQATVDVHSLGDLNSQIAVMAEAKNYLSALIDGLKKSSPALIVDRGRPVARLEPVTSLGEGEQDGRLSRLVRDGIVRPGRTPLANSLFTAQPPRPKRDARPSRRCLPNGGTADEVLGFEWEE